MDIHVSVKMMLRMRLVGAHLAFERPYLKMNTFYVSFNARSIKIPATNVTIDYSFISMRFFYMST